MVQPVLAGGQPGFSGRTAKNQPRTGRYFHRYKTGALIVASIELAILTRHAPVSFAQARHLHQFADRIGLSHFRFAMIF